MVVRLRFADLLSVLRRAPGVLARVAPGSVLDGRWWVRRALLRVLLNVGQARVYFPCGRQRLVTPQGALDEKPF